ncbi:MAG: YfiR family protein [Gammaproteobacteria bacterium]|nr:YfiR family protein [Gammaproteobacteria bacterium]
MMLELRSQVASPWLPRLRLCCLWLLMVLLPLQLIAAPPSAEYKLKAALIYKLSKFVEWPDLTGADKSGSFGICVLGEDVFGSALDALEQRKAAGRTVRVRRFTQSESIGDSCQVVFISKSKRAFMGAILQKLKGRPILTLGDTEGFAEQGGIIEFTRGKKRIGFLINLESARRSGLKIAAPLLDLATVLDSPDN